jgi:hypothetical protein
MENARWSERATLESVNPGFSGVENPMMPVSLTTGTSGISLRKRRGRIGRNTSTTRLRKVSKVEVGKIDSLMTTP